MELSSKQIILSEYLNLDGEGRESIVEIDECNYEYNGDTYLILDSIELDYRIDQLVDEYAETTKYYIDQLDLSEVEYSYYMCIEVDYDAIRRDIESNIADFVGIGTYEEYDGYYIFLIQ